MDADRQLLKVQEIARTYEKRIQELEEENKELKQELAVMREWLKK